MPVASYKRGWIYLALGALLVPGIASIVLVLLRSLEIRVSEWQDIFKAALVIHVDLSIYAWMIITFILLTSLELKINRNLEKPVLYLCATGTILVAISPFFGKPQVTLSNYIPVLESGIFFAGIIIFALASSFYFLFLVLKPKLSFGIRTAGILYVLAVFLVIHSIFLIDKSHNSYFEIIFWGGGHMLQLVITMLMLLAWTIIIKDGYSGFELSKGFLNFLYLIMLLAGLYALYIHFSFNPNEPEYRIGMTRMMQWGGGISAVLLAGYILLKTTKARLSKNKALNLLVFYASLSLFVAGGLIGLLISGSNTIVPAHYHGSIVAVTIALMGLIYYYLPRLGYAKVQGKLALSQPLIYALGQLMHIAGLVIIGGAGAARKLAGNTQVAGSEFGIMLVRFGGLIAVIGGILFIVVVVLAMKKPALDAK